MPTNTAGSSARVYHQGQTHYIDLAYTFSTMTGSGVSVPIGTIPAGSYVVRASAAVTTTFNGGTGGTANAFSIGTTAATANLVASTGSIGTAGVTSLTMLTTTALIATVDQQIWLNCLTPGSAATTGAGLVAVEYIVPDSALV